jgi:hypothetical protein
MILRPTLRGWWSKFGDKEATLDYRQHGGNVGTNVSFGGSYLPSTKN